MGDDVSMKHETKLYIVAGVFFAYLLPSLICPLGLWQLSLNPMQLVAALIAVGAPSLTCGVYLLGKAKLNERREVPRSEVKVVISIVFFCILLFFVFSQPEWNTSASATAAFSSVNVDVFWDEACTEEVKVIDWGILMLGQTVERTVYVLNQGMDSCSLNMTFKHPPVDHPRVDEYLNVTWNQEGTILQTGEVTCAVFKLHILIEEWHTPVDHTFYFPIRLRGISSEGAWGQ